jgi:methionyl aminopeptidase
MIHDSATLDIFRENGQLIRDIRLSLIAMAQNGADCLAIDNQAKSLIKKAGGESAFMRVKGYHHATCICINDGFVHCIPQGKPKQGDIVTIDTGMFYHGTTTDVATTFLMGEDIAKQDFLSAGKKALSKAIKQTVVGNTVRDITKALQKHLERSGFRVTRDLCGHGLGATMHESPQIPLYDSSDPDLSVKLQPGMVLAVEAMYMAGDWKLKKDPDGWTLRTADGSLSGMFEEDVIVTESGPEVITV